MNCINQMMQRILLIPLIILTLTNLQAQNNCFENLGEVSGIDFSQYSTELNSAACELIETLPIEYQPDFKVFDFGFYALEEYMDTDVDALWADVQLKAQTNSQYYLLIGKLSGKSGIYSEFLVDLKLPPIFDSECADIVTRKIAEIKNILNSESNSSDFVQKEKEAMKTLHDVGVCEICDDGIDNDGDGFTDCDDFDCLYLQIAYQLKETKNASSSRSGCTPLSTEQSDIFEQSEEYIVSLGYESSEEVIAEIEALNIAQCIVGALVSVCLDYTSYWFVLNLENDEYYNFFSTTTAETIFQQYGLTITVNAGVSCIESCIPLVKGRIKQAIQNLGVGFATGFIDAAEVEYNSHLANGCNLEEIILNEMDWGKIFSKAGTSALINVVTSGAVTELQPLITTAFNNNKARVIDRIKRGLGNNVWLAIKKEFINEGTAVLESVITQLRRFFRDNNLLDYWDNFIEDFGNVLANMQWFISKIEKRVKAWKVLDDMVDDIGVSWKTDIATLTKLSDDISLNPNLEGWLKNNPGYFDVWNSVKHVPPATRADLSFLQAIKKIVDNLPLQKHIDGELKVTTKSYGYKIRVSGYHKNLDEIDLPNPIHGDAGIPNSNNPNDITIVSIGTPPNPATKGKIRISNKLNQQGGDLPYTAQVDAEIPPGSGNFFPKTGSDGINPGSGRSSIFPENWTQDKMLEEIAYARRNITPSDVVPNADGTPSNLYKSLNSNGTFEIQMYINGPLSDMSSPIGSAFPKINS